MTQGIRDIGLLLARLGFAFALFRHGWTKLVTNGFDATAAGFAQIGIPLPEISAGVAIAGEVGGSILLAVGLITPIAGLVTVVAMFGAVLTAPGHLFKAGGFKGELIPLTTPHPPLSPLTATGLLEEGWVGASAFIFGVAALALAVAGPGRISLDQFFFGKSQWFGPNTSVKEA